MFENETFIGFLPLDYITLKANFQKFIVMQRKYLCKPFVENTCDVTKQISKMNKVSSKFQKFKS